jgi:hypothetical protein
MTSRKRTAPSRVLVLVFMLRRADLVIVFMS